MGYHVGILRTRNGNEDPITRQEIERLAASRSGLLIEPSNLTNAVFDLVVRRDDQNATRLTLQNGALWTKNPSDQEIGMMLEVAAQLNARVRGDEFETYRLPTETYTHPDDLNDLQYAQACAEKTKKAARHRQVILNVAIIGFSTIAVAIVVFFRCWPCSPK